METGRDRATTIVPMPINDTPTPTSVPTGPVVYPSMWPYRYTDIAPAFWSHEGLGLYCPQRRKLIPKDSTGALKLWLEEHRRNPYPSKAEKIMLAILSKMTLTQVSTWFANARRRLKKEFPVDYAMEATSEPDSVNIDSSETLAGAEYVD